MMTNRVTMRVAVMAVLSAALAGCAAADAPRAAATPLSEEQAVREAGRFLQGTYYGEGPYDAINNIGERKLLPHAPSTCGAAAGRPVWAFSLVRPYKGWLYLDAATGEKLCSTLPFIR